jgi:hypothetical protein
MAQSRQSKRKKSSRQKPSTVSRPNPLPAEIDGYKVRQSQRAKRLTIKVSSWGEVEVVVPPGTAASRVTQFLRSREDWIQKTKAKVQTERRAIAHETAVSRPPEIVLRALDETWTVSYTETNAPNVTVEVNFTQHQLSVTGQIDQISLCHELLGRWVRDYARHHLTSWLEQVSKHTRLPFNRVAIRRQKTRWGSCSSQKNINLNDKLLFLPKDLVHYVLVHELCHTIHLNHSPKFWALVEEKEPNYHALDKELRTAWRYVPRWLTES